MTADRHLDWEGCFNVRDLGGIATADGREIRRGAVVRADGLDRLTAAGWAALWDHGIRTVVDLRNEDELGVDAAGRPVGVETVHLPLDDAADAGFWQHCRDNQLDGSPLYYRPFLDRKGARCASVLAAVARARPGGVVIHCVAGRDRTGLITLLLLAVAGVAAGDIAADYELSTARLPGLFAALGLEDEGPEIQAALARRHTSARATIAETLASLDVPAYLLAAGLTEADLSALRARLLA